MEWRPSGMGGSGRASSAAQGTVHRSVAGGDIQRGVVPGGCPRRCSPQIVCVRGESHEEISEQRAETDWIIGSI